MDRNDNFIINYMIYLDLFVKRGYSLKLSFVIPSKFVSSTYLARNSAVLFDGWENAAHTLPEWDSDNTEFLI